MIEYALLAAVAALTIALLFFRTHTAICFLALCAGSVLLGVSGDNAALMASSLTSGMSSAATIARVILLFVPLTICAVALRGYIKGPLLMLAFLPALCVSLLSAILLVPLLGDGLEAQIHSTASWDILVQYQEAIFGIGLVASLSLIVSTIKKPKEKKKH